MHAQHPINATRRFSGSYAQRLRPPRQNSAAHLHFTHHQKPPTPTSPTFARLSGRQISADFLTGGRPTLINI